MLKIDMHVHTWYSDSTGSVEEVLGTAHQKGLDGIAVTDHRTLRGAREALKKSGNLIIIPGEEVQTDKGEILAIGIKEAVPEKLPVTEVIERIHIQGGLAIIPHPTVPFFSKLTEEDLKNLLIDGLEVFSAITPWPEHFLAKNHELARRLGIAVVAGSDSHSAETVGDAYTIVNSKSRDLKDILEAIKLGNSSVGGGPSRLVFKLRMAKGGFIQLLRWPFTS